MLAILQGRHESVEDVDFLLKKSRRVSNRPEGMAPKNEILTMRFMLWGPVFGPSGEGIKASNERSPNHEKIGLKHIYR